MSFSQILRQGSPDTAREAEAECLHCALQPDGPAQVAGLYIFESIKEVLQIVTEGLCPYNTECPNMGNGAMTFAQKLRLAA